MGRAAQKLGSTEPFLALTRQDILRVAAEWGVTSLVLSYIAIWLHPPSAPTPWWFPAGLSVCALLWWLSVPVGKHERRLAARSRRVAEIVGDFDDLRRAASHMLDQISYRSEEELLGYWISLHGTRAHGMPSTRADLFSGPMADAWLRSAKEIKSAIDAVFQDKSLPGSVRALIYRPATAVKRELFQSGNPNNQLGLHDLLVRAEVGLQDAAEEFALACGRGDYPRDEPKPAG